MNNKRNPLRPGMTAIAAVIALSSTPLFAQAVDAPAPLVEVSPPVVSAPAPVAVQAAPLDVAPVAPAPAPAVSAAPAPETALRTTGTPVVHTPDPEITSPSPAARARSAAPRAASVAPAPDRLAAAQPAPVAPVAAAPVTVPEPAPAPKPAVARTAASQSVTNDATLPMAAGTAILVLALGGGALAFARRRRDGDAVYAPSTPLMATDSEPVAVEPVHYAAPDAVIPPSESVSGPVTALPPGFDLSRFGRHSQAAYRGPTADNPSLSLRRRLKRANFYDQRERMAGHVGEPTHAYAPVVESAAVVPQRQTDHITTRMPRAPRPTFRPAYSS